MKWNSLQALKPLAARKHLGDADFDGVDERDRLLLWRNRPQVFDHRRPIDFELVNRDRRFEDLHLDRVAGYGTVGIEIVGQVACHGQLRTTDYGLRMSIPRLTKR